MTNIRTVPVVALPADIDEIVADTAPQQVWVEVRDADVSTTYVDLMREQPARDGHPLEHLKMRANGDLNIEEHGDHFTVSSSKLPPTKVYVPVRRAQAPRFSEGYFPAFRCDLALDRGGTMRWCGFQGSMLAAGTWDPLHLWGDYTIVKGHIGDVTSAQLFPSGQVILSTGLDTTVRVSSALDGSTPRTLVGHRRAALCAAPVGIGRHVVSGSADATVRLWDVSRGAQLASILVAGSVNAVASDGVAVYAGTEGGLLGAWDLRTSKRISSADTATPVDHVCYEAGRVLTCARDGVCTLFDTRMGAVMAWQRDRAPVSVAQYTGGIVEMSSAIGNPCRIDTRGAGPTMLAEFSGVPGRADAIMMDGRSTIVATKTEAFVYRC